MAVTALVLAAVPAVVVGSAGPAAAADTTLVSTDFSDGTFAPWTASGGATLSVVDVEGNPALQVANRTEDFDGIQTPAGLFTDVEPGAQLTLSMRARLAPETVGSAGVRLVVKPAYAWVGNTTMTADAWTTVTGTYTVPADADPATLQVYLGTGALDGPYTYLVDDLVITTPTAADPALVSTDFTDGTFAPWTASGGATLSVVDVEGNPALQVANRTEDFDGIQTPAGLFTDVEPGAQLTLSMRARLAPETVGSAGVRLVVKPAYAWVGNTTMTADAWTTVTGTYTVPADADPATLQVYLGTGALDGPYTYLVDDLVITGPAGEEPETPDVLPGGALNPTTTPVSAAQGTGDRSALTFDDGPNGADTTELLDFLAAKDIEATFCVIGQNIQAPGGADLLKRIVADGHTLCNHGTSYEVLDGTQAEVEEDLAANLTIIRTALGNPSAQVPFFRAANGVWTTANQNAAVALGMQPLAVTNTIADWETQDEALLTERLRTAMKSGEIVLMHDGGGSRAGTVAAATTVIQERLDAGWSFTLPAVTLAPSQPPGTAVISADFEDGLQGWIPRATADGEGVLAVTDTLAHGGAQSALLTQRTSQGHGIGFDATGVLIPGTSYEYSAWVRFAPGQTVDDIWLSLARTTGESTSYDTLKQFTGMSNSEWVQVTGTFQMSAADSALLYFETAYDGGATGNTSDFLVDDIVVTVQDPLQVQDLPPMKDTVDFPLGAAIDSREQTGSASELLLRHFDQVTSENYMKPEAWYAADKTFTPHPEADAIMAYAQANDLRVYGHTLAWHSQTPAWFFQDDAGTPLTTSEVDQQILRDRLRTHVFAVAEHLSSTYGEFGSDTNPLVAFDVVNEVVSDSGEYEDGLRRSEWYRILGESFVDLAFQYADEAFNGEYAAAGSDRPITLFINDYNTEQGGKQVRLHELVERLLSRGVPVDGVGHQFHVSLAMPVSALEAAIVAFQDLPVVQVVTELDVTTGTPVTDGKLIEQGYYYRDAFRVFRAHAEDLFSVTVWGLTDGRSWRSDSGAPLVFDDRLQAKPAYYGIVDGELPARQRAVNVFAEDVPIDDASTTDVRWSQLPLHPIEDSAAFQLRWAPDHLTAYVRVDDATPQDADAITFQYAGQTVTFGRDGTGDVEGVVTEGDGGYAVVVRLPLATPVAEGGTLPLDVRVTDGTATVAWNTPGALGTLTLVEPLSYAEVVETAAAPAIDGTEDGVWADAGTVRTDKQTNGTGGGATADVRTLWQDNTLYVLAEVTDPVVDVTGSDPWIQDSVEIYVDAGNYKNGSYRYDDTQIRISATNTVSFGTGDEAFQQNRLVSATRLTDTGYVVEASISLLEEGGAGTFHGVDFQVNDASGGARTAIHNWADPTGAGYQSTARWGVVQLVEAAVPSSTTTLTASPSSQVYGSSTRVTLTATVTADVPVAGTVEFVSGTTVLGTATLNSSGVATLRLPASTPAGSYPVVARFAGDSTVTGSESAPVTVTVNRVTTTTGLSVTRGFLFIPSIAIATVATDNGRVPSGTIEIREGTTVVKRLNVVLGIAIGTVPSGRHTYTATFVPRDAVNVSPSTSAPVSTR
ncbi:endo-1,4-beta-xylanase [uncultured Cellulomonas sp.]|uniref:endo-1,4-beta-xylanase n=1 Tax=uncultured Cellulomonas sp. TaxID=189682 RepID=UPI0028E885D2|nr:endo-1,4-beta-xylanase [uncultured Cellulomonas sp.]